MDIRLLRETLIKSKNSQKFNQNSCFKSNVTCKTRVRNVGLCNMALEMRRNAAFMNQSWQTTPWEPAVSSRSCSGMLRAAKYPEASQLTKY